MPDQKAEDFDTPERSQIRDITESHVAEMERSDDPSVWNRAGMDHLMLCTVGRRSGQERKVALPYWTDAEGHPIVVGSYAGAPQHPGWFLNLRDRDANPEVRVRTREASYWASAEILDGDEYTAHWAALTADRGFYADYQKLTERRLPLVRLVRQRDV